MCRSESTFERFSITGSGTYSTFKFSKAYYLSLLVVIDLIMRRATEDKPRGIVWELTNHLEDCDFADDLALLSHSQKDIQAQTTKIERIAKSVGLKINAGKTKLMKIKTKSALKTFANGAELEEVEDFKYLGSYIYDNASMEKEMAIGIAMAAQASKYSLRSGNHPHCIRELK